MLIYIAEIEKIPQDIFEAAKIDGSSGVHSFFHITLPLLRGVFKTTITLWTTGTLGFYIWSQMFSSNRDASAQIMTPMCYMIRTTFGDMASAHTETNAGLGAAICVMVMLAAGLAFALISRIFKNDEFTFCGGIPVLKKSKSVKEIQPLNLKKEARLLPGYIILVLWVLFEIALLSWIVGASFSTTKEIFSNQMLQSGLHFENYIYSWTKGNMGKYFFNSLIYAGFGVSGALLLSAPCAYALSRFKFFYNKALTNLLVLFLSIPQVMVVLPLYSIAVKYNLLNKHLTLLVLYICLNVPFCTFFLLNFFATLSRTFEEAAAVDGCSPIKTFFKIMLPLAQPGIITVGIFLFVNIWNEFFVAMIFATSSDVRPLAYGLYSLIQAMSTNGKWAELFSSVMIVVIPTFILYLFLSEKIIAGVTGGGIKE